MQAWWEWMWVNKGSVSANEPDHWVLVRVLKRSVRAHQQYVDWQKSDKT